MVKVIDLTDDFEAHDDDQGHDPWVDGVSWKTLMYDHGFTHLKLKGKFYKMTKWGSNGEAIPVEELGDYELYRNQINPELITADEEVNKH